MQTHRSSDLWKVLTRLLWVPALFLMAVWSGPWLGGLAGPARLTSIAFVLVVGLVNALRLADHLTAGQRWPERAASSVLRRQTARLTTAGGLYGIQLAFLLPGCCWFGVPPA